MNTCSPKFEWIWSKRLPCNETPKVTSNDMFLPKSIIQPEYIYHRSILVLHGGCLIRSRNCLFFASTWVHPDVWWGPGCSSFFKFSVFCFLFCLSLSCILCTQYCQFLWIVNSWLPLQFSLTCFFISIE